MPGMVGAMIVTVGVILLFVVFRAINRDDASVEREAIDYLPVVRSIQEGDGFAPAYPAELPEDWKAVDVGYLPNEEWSLDVLTDDDSFVGIYQERRSVAQIVEEYVDPDASRGDEVSLPGAVSETWQVWTDEGGDFALSTRLQGTTLLVVGTAGEDAITAFAESLVTDPVS